MEGGNLAVLRELTLRLVAEGVNHSLERHRKERGLVGPSGAMSEYWYPPVSLERIHLYAARTADREEIERRAYGRYVCESRLELTKEQAAFKRSLLKLSERIGVKLEELPLRSRRKLADVLVQYALEHHVTRIVLGHSKQTRPQEMRQGSLLQDLLKKTRGIDIFIVADRAARRRTDHPGADPSAASFLRFVSPIE